MLEQEGYDLMGAAFEVYNVLDGILREWHRKYAPERSPSKGCPLLFRLPFVAYFNQPASEKELEALRQNCDSLNHW